MSTGNWKDKLKIALELIDSKIEQHKKITTAERKEAVTFLEDIVIPAFNELKQIFENHGRDVFITPDLHDLDTVPYVELQVSRNEEPELKFTASVLFGHSSLIGRFCVIDPVSGIEETVRLSTEAGYYIYAITKDMIIDAVVNLYSRHAGR